MQLSSLSRLLKNSSILGITILHNFFGNSACADSIPLAILGGQGDAPYAAFLQSNGSIAKLKGLPTTGLTYRVAMNASSHSIIGGTNGLDAYAALVSPRGSLKSIPGLISPGEIYTVAINKIGNGIVGGGHLDSNIPFAALVSPKGEATPLILPSSGLIYSVALDNAGEGIVGGIGPLNSAYASTVSATGNVTPLIGLPTTGAVYWVAANESKTKFIGGQENTSIYAAYVDPNGSVGSIAGLPLGLNYSVALNASGQAIMGGTSLTLPYAALVNPNGSVINLNGLPATAGKIYTVAINKSGTGIIAGFSTTGPYGSFVASNGKLTPLLGLPTGDGFLDGAALHSSGVAIVGGTIRNAPFAALVAPNGTLTYLNGLPLEGEINSISIAALDSLVPQSIGPFNSLANMQFAFSNTLSQHLLIQKNEREESCSELCKLHTSNCGATSVWLSAFGNYIQEKATHSLPTYSNKIGAVILGIDYNGIHDVVFGGALGYSNNCVQYSHRDGKAHIEQESAALYATWNNDGLFINAALWGGLFQITHKRHSIANITSTAKPSGWNLSPQLEIDMPYQISMPQNFVLDPFITLNWSNNWLTHFREKGSSGFNINLKNHYASIFRSELGVRFFETFQFACGDLILEEKISYVNRAPIGKKRNTAKFIGAASTFEVNTLNCIAQNLGNIQMHAEWIPQNFKNIFFAFDYQGEFGSKFQSHMLTLGLEKIF